jgi:hypothetical protein
MYCTSDDNCGGLSCNCGVCTLPCEQTDCSALGSAAQCLPAAGVANLAALCGTAAPTQGVCVASCATDAECGDGRQCLLGNCIQTLVQPPAEMADVCSGDCGTGPGQGPSDCYMACRVMANEMAQTCLDGQQMSSDACMTAATSRLESCASTCEGVEQGIATGGIDSTLTPAAPDCPQRCAELGAAVARACEGFGVSYGFDASFCAESGRAQYDSCLRYECGLDPVADPSSDLRETLSAACEGWKASSFERSSDGTQPQPGQPVVPSGEQFVRFNATYGLWVGLVQMQGGYQFYLSDSLSKPFLPAADSSGGGEDLCELIDPTFAEGNTGIVNSTGLIARYVSSMTALVSVEVYRRALVGQPFERTISTETGSDLTSVINCGIGPLECQAQFGE